MTELKREYIIPLRRKTQMAPKWRRSKKAVSVLREFITQHMKTEEVLICNELNNKLWENGIKNPPGKVSVVALRMQIGGVEKTLVNLIEFGVDKYVQAYKQTSEMPIEETKEEAPTQDVKDAEVKEVPKKASKQEKAGEEEVKKNE